MLQEVAPIGQVLATQTYERVKLLSVITFKFNMRAGEETSFNTKSIGALDRTESRTEHLKT